LKSARADLIVANDAAREGSAFEADTNDVTVVTPDKKAVRLPPGPKTSLAFQLWRLIHEHAVAKK